MTTLIILLIPFILIALVLSAILVARAREQHRRVVRARLDYYTRQKAKA